MALLNKYLFNKYSTTTGDWSLFGQPFNPTFPSNINGDYPLPNGVTISLSGLQYGHEVIGAIGSWDNVTKGKEILFRKGSTTLFSYTSYNNAFGAYIGIDYDEIMSNGSDYYVDFSSYTYNQSSSLSSVIDYSYPYGLNRIGSSISEPYNAVSIGNTIAVKHYAEVTYTYLGTSSYVVTNKFIDGSIYFIEIDRNIDFNSGFRTYVQISVGKVLEGTLNFQISNFPTLIGPVESGKIWVEGEFICYIDATKGDTGYKHKIANDGLIYGTTSSSNAGKIWIDPGFNGKISYIGSTGNILRTHKGDINGTPGNNEPATSGKTPGMIRVSSPEGNYGYLTFIGADGVRYRIMNGQI